MVYTIQAYTEDHNYYGSKVPFNYGTIGAFDTFELAMKGLADYRKQFTKVYERWERYYVFHHHLNVASEGQLVHEEAVDKHFPVEISTQHYSPTLKRNTVLPEIISEWLHENTSYSVNDPRGTWLWKTRKVDKFYRIIVVFDCAATAMKFKLLWG